MMIGAFVALSVSIVKNLDESSRYEVISRVLYPLFRVGWTTGVLPKFVMLKPIDDTTFRLLGDVSSKDEILSWQVGDDDVVVATYAKSGTHLTIQTALQIMSNASVATGDDMKTLHHFVGIPEIVTTKAVSKCEDKGILTQSNHKELAPLGKSTLWATHLDYHHTPHNANTKYVVMARDPVDVLLSLHSMVSKMLGRLAPRKEELVPMLESASGGWAEFNLEWWKHKDEENVLFVFYEDAVKDHASVIASMTRLLGKPQDSELAQHVLERSSVAYMKARHAVFDPPPCMELSLPIKKPSAKDESMMVNKGKAGSGAKQIDEYTRRHIREYCQRVFSNSDFPFWKFPSCN